MGTPLYRIWKRIQSAIAAINGIGTLLTGYDFDIAAHQWSAISMVYASLKRRR
jgi:hypothetical protein